MRHSTENIWLPQRGELGRELAHLELVAVSRQHQLQVVHVVHLRVEQLLDNVLTSANIGIGTCILIRLYILHHNNSYVSSIHLSNVVRPIPG